MPGQQIAKDMDTWDCMMDGIPYGLYLYYLDDANFKEDYTSILGNCSAIQSVQYTPFMEPGDMITWRIPYDVDRFGRPDSVRPKLDGTPEVIRIIEPVQTVRPIGNFNLYKIPPLTIKGKRSWVNESRLYNYPFSFALLTDYLNPPMTIKYHLCSRQQSQQVGVRQTISDRCSYGLFVYNYKNDYRGNMEAMVSGDAHELPCTSSAYSQWFATSKNQTQFGVNQGVQESFMQQRHGMQSAQLNQLGGAVSGLMGTLGSALSGNIGGVLSSTMGFGMNMLQGNMVQTQLRESGAMQRQGIIGASMAQQKDLRSTPNTLVSQGSDIMYGLKNGEKKVDLIRYMVNEEFARKIGDYFAMYGYKQNRLMRPNIRNRYYYNYIKTNGANIGGNGIPRDDLESLKQIFDNGVTIWHMDREGVTVGNYSMDNYEIE